MEEQGTIHGHDGAIGAVADDSKDTLRAEEHAVAHTVTEEQNKRQEMTDENLKAALMDLLEKSDLNVMTEKMLRKELEKMFGDLSEKKAFIKGEIRQYVLQQLEHADDDDDEEEGEEEEEEGEDVPVARTTGKRRARFGQILSYEMSEFLGMEECPRGQVVKKLWEYIKANKLQDPKNGQRIILDDKLKVLFSGRKSMNMFAMNKMISKHVFIDDTMYDQGKSKKKPVEKKRVNPAGKSTQKRLRADGTPATSVFSKPVNLSPEMQTWVGAETSSRPQIVKQFWNYIKEHNLQDPSDRRYVNADETLKKLTGESRFLAFSFSKLIKPHILGYV